MIVINIGSSNNVIYSKLNRYKYFLNHESQTLNLLLLQKMMLNYFCFCIEV